MIRTGSGEVVNTVISGERPLAAMVLQYHALRAVSKGAKLRVRVPKEGAPVSHGHLAIAADAANPEAAKTFMDFAFGRDAQIAWQQTYFTDSMRDDMPEAPRESGAIPLNSMKRIASTPADMIEFFNNNIRSEEHTSELQSLMRISYAVFCLKKQKYKTRILQTQTP